MASAELFDLVVIGGGPAGYHAAIRAAQLKLKVACIEKEKALGGTCLNVGCIPSKALLDSSEMFDQAKHEAARHGVILDSVKLDLSRMMQRKNEVVQGLTSGIKGLFKKNAVVSFEGHARLISASEIEIQAKNGDKTQIKAKKIILATGSVPVSIPAFPIDENRILSSTGALSLSEVPKSLVVIGGGVIGLELGSVWHRLGASVTVIEAADQILSVMDKDLGKELNKILTKKGMQIQCGVKVQSVTYKNKQELEIQLLEADGKASKLQADYVLVSVGRRPYSDHLGLGEIGITQDKKGFVITDENFQTSVPDIYAVGDLIHGPMLAHKAMEDAIVCVEKICGIAAHVDYNHVPWVVYTHPEVASVGLTEADVLAKNIEYKTGTFPFMAIGRARASGESAGFVKTIAHARTDEILGVHMIGSRVSELIAEMVLALVYKASSEDIARTVHAHPTLSEAVKESSLAVHKAAIHI